MDQDNKKINLKSSISSKGKTVTKIVHFSKGRTKTFNGVITDSVMQSEFTRFETIDGRLVYVNPKNVDFFEVFEERNND